MLLTIDIGNTNIVLGLFKEDALVANWRISTDPDKTFDEYGILISGILSGAGFDKGSINGAIMASVVPALKDTFTKAVTGYVGVRPLIVGPGIKTGIAIATDDPREVGADRIVNAVAAYNAYKRALIIVDFGTAITFDYVTEKGEYAGGAIAPGISISADALVTRTAQLRRVELTKPASAIGKNTVDGIRAGLFYGFVALADGIIERIKKETGSKPFVVATGGLARIFAGEIKSIDEYDEFLVLKGLRLIYEANK